MTLQLYINNQKHLSIPMDLIFLAASFLKFDDIRKKVSNDSVSDNHLKLDNSNCIMDTITKNPGLQHISEDIFKLLDNKSLMNCRLTNSSWKNILQRPIFWLQKLEREGWGSLSKLIGDRHLAGDLARELRNFKGLPIYVRYKWKHLSQELEIFPMVEQQPREFLLILINIYHYRQRLFSLEAVVLLDKQKPNKYVDLVKSILENENPCSRVTLGSHWDISWINATSIHLAAFHGFTGVVEKLCKKYDDPLVNDLRGCNAMHFAAMNGHTNIVKHLMGFTEAPLAPDNTGWTPLHYAAYKNNLHTVKFLVGLTNTPNAPTDYGYTPIEIAKRFKNMRVQKFLEDYCK